MVNLFAATDTGPRCLPVVSNAANNEPKARDAHRRGLVAAHAKFGRAPSGNRHRVPLPVPIRLRFTLHISTCHNKVRCGEARHALFRGIRSGQVWPHAGRGHLHSLRTRMESGIAVPPSPFDSSLPFSNALVSLRFSASSWRGLFLASFRMLIPLTCLKLIA